MIDDVKKPGYVDLHRVPKYLAVHHVVSVDQVVSCPGDFPPRNVGALLLDVFRKTLDSFADDLDESLQSGCRSPVGKERFEGVFATQRSSFLCRIANLRQGDSGIAPGHRSS